MPLKESNSETMLALVLIAFACSFGAVTVVVLAVCVWRMF
jgi:hypothetical protein